jgi:hypothetical protein
MVKSQIIKANGEPVKVDYLMRQNGDSWQSRGFCRWARHQHAFLPASI